LNKEIKEELFSALADWIIDNEPNYPSFAQCKFWIKNQDSQYVISKNDEKKNSNVVDLSSYESTSE